MGTVATIASMSIQMLYSASTDSSRGRTPSSQLWIAANNGSFNLKSASVSEMLWKSTSERENEQVRLSFCVSWFFLALALPWLSSLRALRVLLWVAELVVGKADGLVWGLQ